MKPKQRIDQLLAGFADGDAISRAAVRLRDIFRAWGHAADIFAEPECVSPGLRPDCRPLQDYNPDPTDICLHHYGIVSPAAEMFFESAARKVLVYHNITPAHYFEGYDDDLARRLTAARARLTEATRLADAVWAVSRFNAAELETAGARDVKVMPLPFDPAPLDLPPDAQVYRNFRVKLKTILFVGRIVPNKRVEDLIQSFAWYNYALNPFSRLVIVGSARSCPRYFAMLKMLVGDLDLPNVCFEGFASPAGLVAYYNLADLYLSTSAHEGYCLPLVEAMYKGVPVISRATGGTPEALDGAGVLYEDLMPAELAGLVHMVFSDPALRGDMLNSQQHRIRKIGERDLRGELKALMTGLMIEPIQSG